MVDPGKFGIQCRCAIRSVEKQRVEFEVQVLDANRKQIFGRIFADTARRGQFDEKKRVRVQKRLREKSRGYLSGMNLVIKMSDYDVLAVAINVDIVGMRSGDGDW